MTLLRPLFVATRLWLALIAFVLLFVAAYAFPALFPLIQAAFVVFVLLTGLDGWLLFRVGNGFFAHIDRFLKHKRAHLRKFPFICF